MEEKYLVLCLREISVLEMVIFRLEDVREDGAEPLRVMSCDFLGLVPLAEPLT